MEKLKTLVKPKVVFDTSIYVAEVLSQSGISAKVFEFIIERKIFNFYTEEIFADLIQEVSFQLQQLEAFKIKKCRDPDDDKFLSLAKQVNADFIITWDEDLIVLKHIEKTKIVTPIEFFKLMN